MDQLQRHILLSGQRIYAGRINEEQNYSNDETTFPRRRDSNMNIHAPNNVTNINGSTNV
jgi:hypothetical protein